MRTTCKGVIVWLCMGLVTKHSVGQPLAVSAERLKAHVEALAHDSMQGRLTGMAGGILAAAYLKEAFSSYGLQPLPGQKGFGLPWKQKILNNLWQSENIAGLLPGRSNTDSTIIISAHYDHVGVTSMQRALPFGNFNKVNRKEKDSIFNGANDNASGVAAMLELVRVFVQDTPYYNLLFVGFSGEELGLFGSSEFSFNLPPYRFLFNLNLEMLGRPEKGCPYVVERAGKISFRDLLNEGLRKANSGYPKKYFSYDPYPLQNLFERSDHFSLHNAGITSFSVMGSSPTDRYYHHTDDEAQTLNYPGMQQMVQAIYLGLRPIAMGGMTIAKN